MHDSADRLYQAALTHDLRGPSAVARELDETPQNVMNWEKRGVSSAGAIKAEAVFGWPASWIMTGKSPAAPRSPAPVALDPLAVLDGALGSLCDTLSPMPMPDRLQLEKAFTGLLLAPDSVQLRTDLLHRLADAASREASRPQAA